MNRSTILIFAKRIFSSSSVQKATASLLQLKTLLEEQGAPKSDIDLLNKMIQSAPEMREIAKASNLSLEDVQIAERRAAERRQRELAARSYGRC